MAKVYLSFSWNFAEDADFWRRIAKEEGNHAALLKVGEQYFLDAGIFPGELLDTSLDSLIKANSEMNRFLARLRSLVRRFIRWVEGIFFRREL